MISMHFKAPVVIVGDAVLDSYLRGTVERISPEAPIPVVLRNRDNEVAGGAANAAANAARLGALTRLVSVIGDDVEGKRLGDLLLAAGVEFAPVVDSGRPTTVKTRIMSGNHQLLRIDRETTAPVGPAIEREILAKLQAVLPGAGVLVLSDYAKGVLTDDVLREAIAFARRLNIPVLVDPKRRNFSIYKGATLIKPNRAELALAAGGPCDSDEEIEQAARKVVDQIGAGVLVTRSERGMSYIAPGSDPIHMPTQSKEVFDVSGAGDTTIAMVACGFAAGLPIEQSMRLANLAAGIVVSKPGAATVSLDELRATAEIHPDPALSDGAPGTRQEAVALREHWRREGLIVGFTNGCFDLLHLGHVEILRAAARHCDRLIVGLNTDASTARLKGPTRPIQGEMSRAAVVGAMRSVDLVVLFDEDTPADLIAALSPDVLIKGADYTVAQIVGADTVRAAGGRIVRIPLVDGHSTTQLVQRSAEGGTTAAEPAEKR